MEKTGSLRSQVNTPVWDSFVKYQSSWRIPRASPDEAAVDLSLRLRRRKAHAKSRQGCKDCKARRVKCGEELPGCLRCKQRGVECSFLVPTPEEVPKPARRKPILIKKGSPSPLMMRCSVAATAASLVNAGLTQRRDGNILITETARVFDVLDFDRLRYFESRTCQTIGSSRTQEVYRAELTKLALRHSHLMHAILAMAELHMCHMTNASVRASSKALYHWQRALLDFGRVVAPHIGDSDADAMLATSTLINGLAFVVMDSSGIHSAWPLSSRTDDLRWLSIQGGIGLIMQSVLPLSDNSVLKKLFFDADDEIETNAVINADANRMMMELSDLCEVTLWSTEESNPYLSALHNLRPLFQLQCSSETLLMYLGFIGSVKPGYMQLLHVKDHRALLILGCWYAMICSYDCWWTIPRATMECTAICIYLERYASRRIGRLLPTIATACKYQLVTKQLRPNQ